MSTMTDFSEKDRADHLYQARLNFQRQQRSLQRELDERDHLIAQTNAKLEQTRGHHQANGQNIHEARCNPYLASG